MKGTRDADVMTEIDYKASATWAELTAQPRIWRAWAPRLVTEVAAIGDWLRSNGADEIWLSGAGTSAYIGDALAAGLGRFESLPLRSVPSTDIVANPRLLDGCRPLVISFGRSGNSAESVGVMDALDARNPGAPRLNITCNGESTLARRAGENGKVIRLPDDTHDTGFAMTSSYSTMLLTALALLDPTTVTERLGHLADQAEAIIPTVAEGAEATPLPERLVFTGSGALQFAAREAALKVLELTGGEIAAIWDSSLGFRHGPKSFVVPGTDLVLFRASDAFTARYDDDLAAELSEQFPGARRTVVGPGGEIEVAACPDVWNVPLYVLWAQVTGVIWSARKGFDPDDPFKGRGTLTRVVSGVKLYDPNEA